MSEEALALGSWLFGGENWVEKARKVRETCAAGGRQKLQLVATNCFRCRHFGAL